MKGCRGRSVRSLNPWLGDGSDEINTLHFTPREISPCTSVTGGWIGPQHRYEVALRKFPTHLREIEPRSSSPQSLLPPYVWVLDTLTTSCLTLPLLTQRVAFLAYFPKMKTGLLNNQHVCVSLTNNFGTIRWIFMKFGTQVMPLKMTSMPHF
jgi:hypothetical protein